LTIEETSKTKNPVEYLLYANLIETKMSKVEAIKWKIMEESSNRKKKEQALGEMGTQLQHL
jgi:hypothetical protein